MSQERASLFATQGYVARIYRQEPETRWFRRHVLRRKGRSRLIHAGHLDTFTMERNLNGIASAVFVMRDPMSHLTRMDTWMDVG